MSASEHSASDSPVIDLSPDPTPGENGRRDCKFIIVEHRDKLRLVYGNVSTYKYHANLLHEYCLRFGVPSEWVHKPDLLEPLDSTIDILGGGFLELNSAAKTATFSGASKAYGPYHGHQLEEIVTASPQFAQLAVRFGR